MVFKRNTNVQSLPKHTSVLFLLITSCRITTSDTPKRALRGISNPPVVDLELSNTSPSLYSNDHGSIPSGIPTAYDLEMLSSLGPSPTILEGVPTLFPSNESISPEKPTIAPPTSSPSSFPTSVPTMRCHDKPTYKSPINALTCEDHRGTNCAHFHYLGLNTTQLARLIEDCPVTCRIPCGSFLQFSVALGFTLAAVPGLMDETTKQELEVVTWQYLLAFSRATLDRQVTFEFDEVELLSQAILHEMPRKQKDNLQLSLSLALRMQFQGFTVGVSSDDVSKLLIAGITSDSYQVVLKEVAVFFSEAVMSSSLEQEAAVLETEEKDKRSSLPPIMVTSMVVVLATLLGISLCMNLRSDRWLLKVDILPRSEVDEHLHFTAPPGPSEIEPPTPISHPRSLSSLEDFRAPTFHAGNGVPHMRLKANQSFTINTRSSSSDRKESTETIKNDENVDSDDVSSLDASSSHPEEEAEMEHPLSKVIPPMIVFEDIDDFGGPSDPPSDDPEEPQVPGRVIKASNDLISALRRGKGNADPSILYIVAQESKNMESLWPCSEHNRSSSPFGLEMDSDDDDHDHDEMPDHHCARADEIVVALRRRSGCSDVSEDLRVPDLDLVPIRPSIASLDLNTMATLCTRFQTSTRQVASLMKGEGKTIEESAPEQNRDSPKLALASACDGPALNTPTHLSTPSHIYESNQFSLRARSTRHKRRWSFSPLLRSDDDSLLKPGSGGNVSKILDLSSLRKFQITPPFFERQRLETEFFENDIDQKPTRHEFDAPRNGQLGLVIESDGFTGLVIYSVKDYSPLLGLVQKGDKLVQVDGKNTTFSSLTDMCRLLSTKAGILHGSPANLKIVVLRPPFKNGTTGDLPPTWTHSRTRGNGSFQARSAAGSTSLPNLGITSSLEETDTSHLIGLRPMRNVRFSDELIKGRTLPHHKVRGSF